MKKLLIFTLLVQLSVYSQSSIKISTWNIQNLGRSKSSQTLDKIATIINNFDVIAIQEVVAKDPKGAQAVAEIADILNRKGSKWDYTISDPTKSPSPYISERYAFLWKTSKLTIASKPYLDASLKDICEREPYIIKFKLKKKKKFFYLVNVHARTHNKSPEKEIIHFSKYAKELGDNVIILGDFNLNEKHEVWNTLKNLNFLPAITDSRTTLKRICKKGEYLSHAIDNIFFNPTIFKKMTAAPFDFVKKCSAIKNSRRLSDHLPVFAEFSID